MRKTLLVCLILSLFSIDSLQGQQQPPSFSKTDFPRMLIVDYAMAHPQENASVVRVFMEAGFKVDLRPYYPALVERDASTYDVIVLMGGGDPGMSNQELDLAINYVSRGKALILAVPSNGPYGNRRDVNPGVHDRYQFNTLLNRLNISIYGVDASHELSPILNPVFSFEAAVDHPVSQGLDGTLTARAGTRVLVGSGAEPLLVERSAQSPSQGSAQESIEEPEHQIVRRTLRIQPADVISGEDIELLLRGRQELVAQLHYRNRSRISPVGWNTARFKGKVEGVNVALDTLRVRVAGNRWGAEYAFVDIPFDFIASAFVSREIREEIRVAADLQSMRKDEATFGRLAVSAAGRTDRLDKGFVVVIDREIFVGLDLPLPPLGIGHVNHGALKQYLSTFAQYARKLVEEPAGWSPDHNYPVAQLPGNSKPDIPINNISVLKELPGRVQEALGISLAASLSAMDLGENRARKDAIDFSGSTDKLTVHGPLRGAWDFVARHHEHIPALAELVPELGMDFLWTVAPAESYIGKSSEAGGLQLKLWALPILNRLAGRTTDWYMGLTAVNAVDGNFENALDVRGKPVGLPSRFDVSYLNRYLFEPARVMAQHGGGQSSLKGIVHDWEPRINRSFEPYAMTDVFDDLHFRYFARHLAQTGLYHGEEFRSFMGLSKEERFEWLLKSGHLATYFSLQESNAERLGILYRKILEEISPGLYHGAFIRSLRVNWYHLGFWRGAGTRDRPFLVFSYERPPEWFGQFLRDRGISARFIPVGLLGLLDEKNTPNLLNTASNSGSYVLERGVWLVTDPPAKAGINAPPDGLTREALLDAIKKANSR